MCSTAFFTLKFIEFLWKKFPRISGPAQFKPMLFKMTLNNNVHCITGVSAHWLAFAFLELFVMLNMFPMFLLCVWSTSTHLGCVFYLTVMTVTEKDTVLRGAVGGVRLMSP